MLYKLYFLYKADPQTNREKVGRERKRDRDTEREEASASTHRVGLSMKSPMIGFGSAKTNKGRVVIESEIWFKASEKRFCVFPTQSMDNYATTDGRECPISVTRSLPGEA